jgi:hypothetical protein
MPTHFARLAGHGLALVILVLALILVFEIVMLISVIRNNHISGTAKALWIIGMFFIDPFVAIAYYFTDYKKTK